nr:hypothetical protein [Candidatus Tremblaya princeps]
MDTTTSAGLHAVKHTVALLEHRYDHAIRAFGLYALGTRLPRVEHLILGVYDINYVTMEHGT